MIERLVVEDSCAGAAVALFACACPMCARQRERLKLSCDGEMCGHMCAECVGWLIGSFRRTGLKRRTARTHDRRNGPHEAYLAMAVIHLFAHAAAKKITL